MKIFALTSTDLTGLSGPMGTEATSVNWIKYFKSVENARKYAEKDFDGDINWELDDIDGGITSGDLRYVSYNIGEIELED